MWGCHSNHCRLTVAAAARLGLRCTLVLNGDVPESEIRDVTHTLVSDASTLLGLDGSPSLGEVLCTEKHIGEGYGVETQESQEAALLFARREGVLLDQAYTAKVGAALIDWVRTARIGEHDGVVFWHTGGYPTVFR